MLETCISDGTLITTPVRSVVFLLSSFAIALGMNQSATKPVTDSIETRHLVLKRPNGTSAAILETSINGDPQFSLLDENGSPRLRLAVDGTGIASCALLSKDGTTSTFRVSSLDDGRTSLTLSGANNKMSLALEIGKSGPSFMMVGNQPDAHIAFAIGDGDVPIGQLEGPERSYIRFAVDKLRKPEITGADHKQSLLWSPVLNGK